MTSKEKTFTSFTPEQAAAYASGRGFSYPQQIYDAILDFHGDRPKNIVLDVGTGPGKVVFDLLQYFKQGYGCDSAQSMINQAKQDAIKLNMQDRTEFQVMAGEHCAEAVPDGEVDLLTVAMAAHWFDMPAFYKSAAKALKPGGTLAIWTCSSTYAHPSVQNHAELQRILFDLEHNMLGPFTTEGNAVSRDAYVNLPMPWVDASTADLFHENSFKRIDWDKDGIPSAPPLPDGTPGPFIYDKEVPIKAFAAAISSASMVIRWREAYPDKAHTDEDPVVITVKKLTEANGGKAAFRMCPSVVLLLLRKS